MDELDTALEDAKQAVKESKSTSLDPSDNYRQGFWMGRLDGLEDAKRITKTRAS